MSRTTTKNNKQDTEIIALKTDVLWIKNQVCNHIPTQINKLEEKIDRIVSSILIGIVGVLLMQVLLRFF